MFNKIKLKKDYKKINELFDYFCENKFNRREDKIDLESLFSSDVFVDVFSQRIIENKISMDNTLEILESFLYFDDDELRINIVRKVLEKVYDNDNFINGYCENYRRFPILYELTEVKFNLLISVFIKIITHRINKLSIEVLSWIIHNINMEVILEQQYIDQLIDTMNEKIAKLNNIFDNKNNIEDEFILNYYCKFIELSEYIYDDETIELLKKININKMPHSIKLKIINSMIVKGIGVSEDVILKMFEDSRNGFSTFTLLESLKVKHMIPKNIKLTQEDIAIFRMDEWLRFYSGWNCEPSKLKIIDHYDKDKHRYYIFTFKDLNSEDKEKTMIAISQGYEIGTLKSFGVGEDYSKFDEIEKNYIEQADKLLNELQNLIKRDF